MLGAGNTTAEYHTRGFVYFHGSQTEHEADPAKPTCGKDAWSFNDICWQRGVDPTVMKRSKGHESLLDEFDEFSEHSNASKAANMELD